MRIGFPLIPDHALYRHLKARGRRSIEQTGCLPVHKIRRRDGPAGCALPVKPGSLQVRNALVIKEKISLSWRKPAFPVLHNQPDRNGVAPRTKKSLRHPVFARRILVCRLPNLDAVDVNLVRIHHRSQPKSCTFSGHLRRKDKFPGQPDASDKAR